MTFSDEQQHALKAKLNHRHVKTRTSNGAVIPYVEGWHVIAEANRIFGYDCWDRVTMAPRCIWSDMQRGQMVCFYTAKVRITVRAGGSVITRDGVGTGVGRAASVDAAHEIALKAAETDATKRALATFGNPFGLALYDKDKLQVTRSRKASRTAAERDPAKGQVLEPARLTLIVPDQPARHFDDVEAFVQAVLKLVPTLPTIELLYAFWQAHVETLGELRKSTPHASPDPVAAIIAALKSRAQALGRVDHKAPAGHLTDQATDPAKPPAIEASALLRPKEKRVRSKDHLAFVGKQPCLVCGRRPAHAHHLRFAQPRAMGLKVSDEFTVPLCAIHHDALHTTGDERAWWARHGIIDPLKIAARLWSASRLAGPIDGDEPPLPLAPHNSEDQPALNARKARGVEPNGSGGAAPDGRRPSRET